MRIGIFLVMAGREAGGPETYEHGLVRSLAEIDQANEYHLFCLSGRAAQSFRISQENFSCQVLRPGIRWISIPFALPLAIRKSGVDFLHATFVPPPYCPTEYIFTVHGVDMFEHPEFYPRVVRWRLNHLIRTGLRNAKLVLCVSETVKDIIAERFKLSRERLVVTYNAVGSQFRPVERRELTSVLQRKYGVRRPYALYVGKLQACKNIIRILEAFHQFRHETNSDVQLVLAGHRTWTSSGISETIRRLQLTDHVIELGYVAYDDLPVVYSGASMFVFPSLSEGFGMPVIEAMACGVPVVTSHVDALPEITGNAALLVDPYSTRDIAGAMHRIYTDDRLRTTLCERGLERARLFSWQRTAQQTLSAYSEMMNIDC
jgi:glycosyltransferase involved in cell wall biosynthesis